MEPVPGMAPVGTQAVMSEDSADGLPLTRVGIAVNTADRQDETLLGRFADPRAPWIVPTGTWDATRLWMQAVSFGISVVGSGVVPLAGTRSFTQLGRAGSVGTGIDGVVTCGVVAPTEAEPAGVVAVTPAWADEAMVEGLVAAPAPACRPVPPADADTAPEAPVDAACCTAAATVAALSECVPGSGSTPVAPPATVMVTAAVAVAAPALASVPNPASLLSSPARNPGMVCSLSFAWAGQQRSAAGNSDGRTVGTRSLRPGKAVSKVPPEVASAGVTTIAVVEDDPHILAAVTRGLTGRGHVVLGASTGLGALGDIVDRRPDVVVLDLGLPDIDGLELLRMLRAVTSVPVIVATARDDEGEIIRTLDAGADDYVVKPYSADQLDARIRAVMRRTREGDADEPLRVGGLILDIRSRAATIDGEPLDLSRKEFDLLWHLATRRGEVVSKRELLAAVWRQPYGGPEKTVDVHLSWLRTKLGESARSPRYLRSVRGVGVMLVDPDTR